MTQDLEAIKAGQDIYTKKVLRIYDLVVLKISNTFIWRCPSRRLLAFYNQHISEKHLDVGVGSGYFLAHCQWPCANPSITLMDMNENCLQYVRQRIAPMPATTVVANIFNKLPLGEEQFNSVGLNYVLHCVPGTMAEKAIIFDNIMPHLKEGGVLFGSTILGKSASHNLLSKKLQSLYNKKGYFSNLKDSLEDLRSELEARFTEVTIVQRGVVAIFVAKK